MNHLLYNFSVIMLLVGIIMLTSYITKVYNKNINNSCNNNNTNDDYVYDQRPSNIYNVMFNEPDVWQGFQIIK